MARLTATISRCSMKMDSLRSMPIWTKSWWRTGDQVAKGEIIAMSGETERSPAHIYIFRSTTTTNLLIPNRFWNSQLNMDGERNDYSVPHPYFMFFQAIGLFTITETPSGITVIVAPGFPSRSSASRSASSRVCAGVICSARTISSGASDTKITDAFCSTRIKICVCH